jgi:signal transduction histidine kinase
MADGTKTDDTSTRVLLIEDDAAQARLIEHWLHGSERPFSVEWTDRLSSGLERLAQGGFDVVVVDLGLPDSQGLPTFVAVREANPFIPAVVMTGTDREETAIEAVRRGAQDYIVKGHHSGPTIARALRYAIERKRLEEQLRQSQKMEAVGSLAGGIAHEFNNLLQAIVGYTRYAMEGLSEQSDRHRDLEKVLDAANRAASLTRQLLDFSRPHSASKSQVDLSDTIREVADLLQPLLGTNITLEITTDPRAASILVDPAMLQQALLNLCINARDAMPDGGALKIESRQLRVSESDAAGGILPGEYTRIAVSDSGFGIPPELRDRIMEPFFTTKAPGKGTGLGLAMVYMIIQQHHGHLRIESEQGVGTTILIYLPAGAIAGPTKHDVENLPASDRHVGAPSLAGLSQRDSLLQQAIAAVHR